MGKQYNGKSSLNDTCKACNGRRHGKVVFLRAFLFYGNPQVCNLIKFAKIRDKNTARTLLVFDIIHKLRMGAR